MNRPEMAVMFTAMDELYKSGNYEGLGRVIETGLRESVTLPATSKKEPEIKDTKTE